MAGDHSELQKCHKDITNLKEACKRTTVEHLNTLFDLEGVLHAVVEDHDPELCSTIRDAKAEERRHYNDVVGREKKKLVGTNATICAKDLLVSTLVEKMRLDKRVLVEKEHEEN